MKAMVERLRSMGVPNAAIPSVMELIDEERQSASRPRTSTERSRAHRARLQGDATKTLQNRPEIVPESLHPRPEIVADPPSPRARVLYGEELSNITPIEPSVLSPSVKPKRGKARRAIRPDEQPSAQDCAAANHLSPDDFRMEWRKFRDNHLAKGSLMADWPAAWRTWLTNMARFSARAGPQNPYGTRNGKISVHDALKEYQDEIARRNVFDLFREQGDAVRENSDRMLSAG